MPDGYVEQLTIQSVVFRVPQEYAALVVYIDKYTFINVEVWSLKPGQSGKLELPDKQIATIPPVKKLINGKEAFVSLFPRLPEGTYRVSNIQNGKYITLFAGYISEVYLQ